MFYLIRTTTLALISVAVTSCSSTNLMTISVLQPAPVSVPSYIKNVAIVDRSTVAKQNSAVDVVDKIFSLEGIELDREGAAASINGLSAELGNDRRFNNVFVVPEKLTTPTPTVFASQLSWDVVQQICDEYQADALFSLELFDTDSKISYAAIPVKANTPLGNIPVVEHRATMLTLVKTGWRIYDPLSKNILDEFAVAKDISYSGRGINPVVAANAIIGRKEAVKEVGQRSGQAYAFRIVPAWIRVSRDYYIRGNDNFIIAKRRAQTGQWNSAASLWQQDVNHHKPKIASRACYNMAIINEINGNLDKAIEWAQKSYTDYNNKLALRYVNMLRKRKFDNEVLQAQQSQMTAER